jgi:hypothetical protein
MVVGSSNELKKRDSGLYLERRLDWKIERPGTVQVFKEARAFPSLKSNSR